jgi:hypothetical protein
LSDFAVIVASFNFLWGQSNGSTPPNEPGNGSVGVLEIPDQQYGMMGCFLDSEILYRGHDPHVSNNF